MKTYANWDGDLGSYLSVGDVVDEAMKEHFLNIVPPVTSSPTCIQMGEPHDEVNGKATYSTLVLTDEGWTYAGYCHKVGV